jgi:hypothetical protein
MAFFMQVCEDVSKNTTLQVNNSVNNYLPYIC